MQIVLRDARISFREIDIFRGLNATFNQGLTTVIVGPSGSGKSSLLAAIAGFNPLSSGSIEVLPSSDHSRGYRNLTVSWIPQQFSALGSRSVLDNVMIAPLSNGLSLLEARERSLAALHQVRLQDRHFSVARELSGGELQRVAVARVIAGQADVILADEPTANLDASNTRTVIDIFSQLNHESIVIVATHDPLFIEIADHVVHLREGRQT